MSFSANYRRVRAPQQPCLKIASRVAVLVLITCIFYTLFVNITIKRVDHGQVWNYFMGPGDESNPAFQFTNYRAAMNKSLLDFWISIDPSFRCPSRLLSKVGVESGEIPSAGKWVCGIRTLAKLPLDKETGRPPCVVYSFAMEGDSYFESEILQKTNCSVYLYDSMRWIAGPPLTSSTSSRLHFSKLTIGGEDRAEKRTLELLMELNGHRWIDILKVELNSGEFRALERILSDFRSSKWPIGQLIVKFHVSDWTTQASKSRWLVALFELLEYRGLRLFYNQVEAYAPCCAEFSFINVNVLDKYLPKKDVEAIRYPDPNSKK